MGAYDIMVGDTVSSREEFLEHIKYRARDNFDKICRWVSVEEQKVVFPLYNLSGKMVGYQNYYWKGSKSQNNIESGKYFTHQDRNKLGFIGVEWWQCSHSGPLFVCEGAWEALALSSLGNSIAVLTNNPKHIRQQLDVLPLKTVAVCQNDRAGLELGNLTDEMVVLPKRRDCDELSKLDLEKLLGYYLQ